MDEEIPTSNQEPSLMVKTIVSFISGAVVGVGAEFLMPRKHPELSTILLTSIGAPIGIQLTGRYNSLQERVTCAVAAYTGCVAGQMLYHTFK